MVDAFNATGIIGQWVSATGTNVTGDWTTSLLVAIFVIFFFMISLNIPLEWSMIILVPLFITAMAFSKAFFPVGGIMLLYLGIVFGKMYWTNR